MANKRRPVWNSSPKYPSRQKPQERVMLREDVHVDEPKRDRTEEQKPSRPKLPPTMQMALLSHRISIQREAELAGGDLDEQKSS